MTEPSMVAMMRQVADTCDRANIAPVRVTVDSGLTGSLNVNILTRTRTDLFALCDQVHLTVTGCDRWVLRCVSFPHHPDRQDQP